MQAIDYTLIVVYLGLLLALGFYRRLRPDSTSTELIVGGRLLTLPAFVASLVSTWYGGILGVGEFSYSYGLSNWLVFGVPYYVAALLFALFLAKKARESEVLTIPERLAHTYDTKTAVLGSTIIYLMTVPAAYVLMLGVLCQTLFGWPFWVGVLAGTAFSIVYVFLGGFNSVVRTDTFQFILMFLGFAILLVVVAFRFGTVEFLTTNLPETHLTWHGGNSAFYIATWYVIALATLIEPAFYQRCYAARDAATARRGIFVSIGFWVVFDFLTTMSGLYAKALLPDLTNPVASYPELAKLILPAGLLGIFALSLLSTVMSTVDSYSFLAASTFGHDIVGRASKQLSDREVLLYTRVGLFVSAALAVILAVYFRSAVEIWYVFGSIGTPALLVPVFMSHVGKNRVGPNQAFAMIWMAGLVSLLWYLSQHWTPDGGYWLGLQPVFPGLTLSIILYLIWARPRAQALPEPPK